MSEDGSPDQIFERLGVDRVRLMIQTGGLAARLMAPALAWVAERDAAQRASNEASQAEQLRLAKGANFAAWIAAVAAIIAVLLTAVTVVLALR
jgi:hypothetical protein